MRNIEKIALATGVFLTMPVAPLFAKEIDSSFETTSSVTIVPEKDLTEVPENGLGSISITLDDSADGRSKENVKLGVVPIATIENGEYVISDVFKDSGIDLNNIKTANEMVEKANQLSEMIPEDMEVKELVTNEAGKAFYADVPVGVYLVYVIDVNEYEFIEPFMLSIPTWDDTDELFIYDLDVYPKHNQLPKIEVNKVDKATNKNITSKEFEFTSYSDPECKEKIETVKGDTAEGTALFMVDYGVTYIKETKAPQGYVLSDEVVKIEVNDNGIFVNDEEITEGDKLLYSIVYENSLMPAFKKNVSTSAGTNMGLYLSLLGIAGGSILFILKLKKNNSK